MSSHSETYTIPPRLREADRVDVAKDSALKTASSWSLESFGKGS